jgi:hypothetical protein
MRYWPYQPYWSLEEAIKELRSRQVNRDLVRETEQYLKDTCPIPFGLNGFLARHIASARLEDLQFVERCKGFNLEPVFLEYPEDIFVTNNPSKMRLIKITVLEGNGRRGGPKLKVVYVVDRYRIDSFNKWPLSKIETFWGESLVLFHHRTRKLTELKKSLVINISPWLKSIGSAQEYYPYLFLAAAIRGILFESFESPGFQTLDNFYEEVVSPAYEWVKEKFGIEPLIVYHPECSSPAEEHQILNWYPATILPAFPSSIFSR